MTKDDFKLKTIPDADAEYKDYWFSVSEKADKELCKRYSEQGLHHIFEVVYAKNEDAIGIKKQFIFNKYVQEIEDDELKEILKQIIREEETQEKPNIDYGDFMSWLWNKDRKTYAFVCMGHIELLKDELLNEYERSKENDSLQEAGKNGEEEAEQG